MSTLISAVLIITTILSAFCMVFASGPSIPSSTQPSTGTNEVTTVAGWVVSLIQFIAFAAAVIMFIVGFFL